MCSVPGENVKSPASRIDERACARGMLQSLSVEDSGTGYARGQHADDRTRARPGATQARTCSTRREDEAMSKSLSSRRTRGSSSDPAGAQPSCNRGCAPLHGSQHELVCRRAHPPWYPKHLKRQSDLRLFLSGTPISRHHRGGSALLHRRQSSRQSLH